MKRTALLAVLALMTIPAHCEEPFAKEQIATGAELYATNCSPCHGATAEGTGITKKIGAMAVVANLHDKRIVELPDGERFWHHVVRLHRAAMMVLVDDRDRVLLLWRHRFVQDKWGWELPGGLIDEGEEPSATAVRELEEETGYRAGRVEHLVTFQPMVGMVDSEHFVFRCDDARHVGPPSEKNEADRMEWIPLAKVLGMIDRREIVSAGSLVGLMRLLLDEGGYT